jgi:hypothetical protein
MIAVARVLARALPQVRTEVTATKAAWPFLIDGIRAPLSTRALHAIALAVERSAALALPSLFSERGLTVLTGPGSGIGELFRSFWLLATRGWRMIDAAVTQIEHGSPAAARFARANVALYIESVYDAHFSLAQLGKQVLKGWEKLGQRERFGSTLAQSEVSALVAAYSQPRDLLMPHAKVKLGS